MDNRSTPEDLVAKFCLARRNRKYHQQAGYRLVAELGAVELWQLENYAGGAASCTPELIHKLGGRMTKSLVTDRPEQVSQDILDWLIWLADELSFTQPHTFYPSELRDLRNSALKNLEDFTYPTKRMALTLLDNGWPPKSLSGNSAYEYLLNEMGDQFYVDEFFALAPPVHWENQCFHSNRLAYPESPLLYPE